MRGEVQQTLAATASVDEVWAIVTDVQRVATWLPIVSDVVEHEPLERYTATLTDRVGPFRLRADLDVAVDTDDRDRVAITATGEDRQVKSRIAVSAEMRLESTSAGTTVELLGRYEVTGRVATLGAATIRSKAATITDTFCARASEELAR